MNPDTREQASARIDRVIARLQRAIVEGGELPDLAELAGIAHLSSFHFHRVYRALTGETIGRTVARLRLVRALQLLADADLAVTDVALSIGYETSQAFARAFRDAFGISATQMRRQPAHVARELGRLSRPPVPAAGERAPLRIDVVSIEPFEVVALRTTGAYADLDQAFGRLFNWAAEAGIVDKMTDLYGIPRHDHRDTPAAELVFDCALKFSAAVAPIAPMRSLQICGGDHARIRHVGSFLALEDTTDRVLAEWLPGSGRQLRDLPIHYAYLDDPENVPEAMLRTDIYVPLQSLEESGA
jgi:AraC family transcriptional regulator